MSIDAINHNNMDESEFRKIEQVFAANERKTRDSGEKKCTITDDLDVAVSKYNDFVRNEKIFL